MIDSDWLEKLSFKMKSDWQVEGLLGVGNHNVVLKTSHSDGKEGALRISKRTLGFHINQIPPALSDGPQYNLDEVNAHLAGLVGKRNLDTISFWLDNLYSLIIKIISDGGVPKLIFSNMSPDSTETIPFILHTPPIRRRLKDIVEWVIDEDDPLSMMPSVNGERYSIRLTILPDQPTKWAVEAIEGLERLPEHNEDLCASDAFSNWLVVWGVAAMEGFFTDEELPMVARYLEQKYGRVANLDNAHTIIGQVNAFANLFAQYIRDCPVDRMVALCAHCGVLFQAFDRNGNCVADGLKLN